MEPFRLIMELRTPVIFRNGWVTHLDGLLEYGLFCCDGNFGLESGKLDDFLLRHSDGFYHASALSFGVTAQQTLIGVTMNTIGKMGVDDLQSEAIAANGGTAGKPRYSNLLPGGPQAPRLTEYEAYHAPYVVFDGVGNGQACAELLRHTLLGVGSHSARGFSGSVGRIDVRGLSDDFSIRDEEGELARTIPVYTYQHYWPDAILLGTSNRRIRPPYHQESERQRVVLPSVIRRTVI